MLNVKLPNLDMSSTEKTIASKVKILIVDDQVDNLELLSTILASNGYEVAESDHGGLAIELAQANPPNLILLDINMPQMDGFEVCQIFKSNNLTKDIPVIFISALKEIKDKTQAFKIGGDDYITKPFYMEEVLLRVENQLKKYRLQLDLKAKNDRLQQEKRQLLKTEDKLRLLNRKLDKLANLDSLTKIANRHRFDQVLINEWQRASREKSFLSLIIADIDYFKFYNDHFGHQAGDVCLANVAQAISQTVNRPADLVARYGGEEFAIILPQTSPNNALFLAQNIRLAVQKLNLLHPKALTNKIVSLSLGVTSIIPNSKYTVKQLIVTADMALYQAKKQGRARAILKLLNEES